MKIAYEVTALAQSPYGGIAQVCYHTLQQAARHPEITPTALFRHGDPSNLSIGKADNIVAWVAWSWLDRFRRADFDIVHALCHRLPTIKGKQIVFSLHDAWSLAPNPYQSPGFQKQVGRRLRNQLLQADAIVCGSHSARDDLLGYDLVDPSRCHVAMDGVSPPDYLSSVPSTRPRSFAGRKPFVLFVGRLEVRKNLPHVIEAVLPLEQFDLVLVGEPGYGHESIANDHLSRIPDHRLHVLSQLTPGELDWLYRQAIATLLPSFEEGFGLPILEAMIRGCPVITSNCSASAEVGGYSAVLVDPHEPSQSTTAILHLNDDDKYRADMIDRGLSRASEFGWDRYFESLLETYRGV